MLRRDFLALLPSGAAALAGPNYAPTVTGPAALEYSADFLPLPSGGSTIRQTVTVIPHPGASGPIRVDLPRCARLPAGDSRVFLPSKNGIARRLPSDQASSVYEFAGAHAAEKPHQLAIPLISEYSAASDLRITIAADPLFTTCFSDTIHWIYSAGVPLRPRETRTVYTSIHKGDDKSALDAFYQTALRDVPAGPDWLHDIAMVDYDFLSDHGKGWFADIDTLTKVIAPPDRRKVLLALHGWYDFCGRYTFDFKTKSLDRKWLAFPNAESPEFRKAFDSRDAKNPYRWAPEIVHSLRPIEMTRDDLRRRIRYAKSRGFRVALYFADGLNACDGIETFDPSKVLRWGGWIGPETRGKSYALNPLHPEVPAFFKAYLQALLDEHGREVDAFVWDETFYVQPEDLGAPPYRGHAAGAMMELVKDLTLLTTSFHRDLAFLASDNLGTAKNHRAPYALMAHGTYQDSGCAPIGWPYGLFPNFRNTIWSCNWAPVRLYDRTAYAADIFDVPVAISNGYAEDLGVSEMTPDQLKRILDLFHRRKSRRMDLTWIEDSSGALTYKSRSVAAA